MARRRRRVEDEETSYWLSYSDMMAALLLMFVLIITFTMLESKKGYEEKEKVLAEQQAIMADQQEQLDRLVGVKSELIEALKEAFKDSDLSVSVDPQTGSITFDSSVLFDFNKSVVKPTGEAFLQEFLPKYLEVLLSPEYKEYVSEIIIEGHTDTQGDYLTNLELSQKRALSVATYCLDESKGVLSASSAEELRSIVTANGRSFSNPIYNEDGTVNMDGSRRVEFKFRLKNDDMITEMMEILN